MYSQLFVLSILLVSAHAERFMHIKIVTSSNDSVFKVENAVADWGRFCKGDDYDEISADDLNAADIDILHPFVFTPRSRPWFPVGIEGTFSIAAKMEDNSTKKVSQVSYDFGFWHYDGTLRVSPVDHVSEYTCSRVESFTIQCDKVGPTNGTMEVVASTNEAIEVEGSKNETDVIPKDETDVVLKTNAQLA